MGDGLTPEISAAMTRRQFFRRSTAGIAIGIPALATLLATDGFAADDATNPKTGGLVGLPHFPPKARRVIFLHQSGAPSQMELFDYKPNLVNLQGSELPDSVRMGQRITGMTSGQSSFPVAPSIFKFSQYGKSGAWISELLPHRTELDLAYLSDPSLIATISLIGETAKHVVSRGVTKLVARSRRRAGFVGELKERTT